MNLPIPPSKALRALNNAPMYLQDRPISMPGPNGTADTEIGRPGLLFRGTAFSKTSLSPAHSSYSMSTSTKDTPPIPRSAPTAGKCSEPKKATHVTKIPTEYGKVPTSSAVTGAAAREIHSPSQMPAGPGKKARSRTACTNLRLLGRAPADQTNGSGAVPLLPT